MIENIAWLAISVGAGALCVLICILVWYVVTNQNDIRRRQLMAILVSAAEQMYTSEQGKEKLAYVTKEFKKRYPKVDTDLVRAMIESAVNRLYDT